MHCPGCLLLKAAALVPAGGEAGRRDRAGLPGAAKLGVIWGAGVNCQPGSSERHAGQPVLGGQAQAVIRPRGRPQVHMGTQAGRWPGKV